MLIEEIILNCLIDASIDGVEENVYCETPLYPPDEYILIERTAGSMSDHLWSAMIAVQSISKESLYRAAQINDAVVNTLLNFGETSTDVYSCELNSNYNFTDTETKEYRYQAIFNIHY